MLKSEQLDRLMVQQRPPHTSKVESRYVEAKLLDFSTIIRPEETSGDLEEETNTVF